MKVLETRKEPQHSAASCWSLCSDSPVRGGSQIVRVGVRSTQPRHHVGEAKAPVCDLPLTRLVCPFTHLSTHPSAIHSSHKHLRGTHHLLGAPWAQAMGHKLGRVRDGLGWGAGSCGDSLTLNRDRAGSRGGSGCHRKAEA